MEEVTRPRTAEEAQNDAVCQALMRALSQGWEGLRQVPVFIKDVVRNQRWKRRVIEQTGESVKPMPFKEFVEEPMLRGLGSSIEQLEDICQRDPVALGLIEEASQRRPGPPKGNKNAAKTTYDNITHCFPREYVPPSTGTSNTYAFRKLRKDRPDLHKRVLTGELSPHAAMVEAGFRPKTATFYPEDIDRTARALLKHFDPDRLMEAIRRAGR